MNRNPFEEPFAAAVTAGLAGSAPPPIPVGPLARTAGLAADLRALVTERAGAACAACGAVAGTREPARKAPAREAVSR
jgi:hypothetical protein